MSETITDGRRREWELFSDRGYFDMVCVRCTDDTDFNSPTSFHFRTRKEAERFLKLIGESS